MSTSSIWFATLNSRERAELESTAEAPLVTTPDVLIVGAGLVGLATAYYAAEAGARVQVVDAGPVAGAASGANAGGVCPNVDGGQYPPAYHELAHLSRDLWARLSVRPGFDFDWRVPGFLLVDESRFGPSAEEFAAAQLEQGFSLQAVDGEQIAMLEPQLAPGIRAGVLYPSEGHLHPVKAALSLLRGLRKAGGGCRTGVRALSVDRSGGRITSVETTSGRIAAGSLVACTGFSQTWLCATPSDEQIVAPFAGQMLATAPLPPLLQRPIGGRYILVQLRSGEIITGGNLEPTAETVPDPRISEEIAAAARELVPALRDVPFPVSWCGVRPGTPDHLPIIDRVAGLDNAYQAVGHFKKGVLLAPASGKLLADWVRTGGRPDALAGFSRERFA